MELTNNQPVKEKINEHFVEYVDGELNFNNGDKIYVKIGRKNIPGEYLVMDYRGLPYSEQRVEEEKEKSKKAVLSMLQLKYFHNGEEVPLEIFVSKKYLMEM